MSRIAKQSLKAGKWDAIPGAPGDRDVDAKPVKRHRDRFGSVLWLFGDSILSGFALGGFSNVTIHPSHPLWGLRSPSSMINLALKAAGLLELDARGLPVCGDRVAAFAGPSGQHQAVEIAVDLIGAMSRAGQIRRGDQIVFHDAGPHTCDPDRYEEQWLAIRSAALRTEAETIWMCSSFDNLSDDRRRMYDVEWPSRQGPRSHNDATRAAAHAAPDGGRTRFLDLGAALKRFHQRLDETFGRSAFLPDNVHLNVCGQLALARELIGAAWPGLDMTPLERLMSRH